MSPVRNASRALGDVMRRSEIRGARQELERLEARAQAFHERAHSARELGFRECSHPVCATLAEVLAEPPAPTA